MVFQLGNVVVFLIGLLLCVLSAFCSVLGVNLQKLSHINIAKLANKKASYLKQWRWWCGMLLVILGAVLDFASLGFAPQTVVAAFGSFTLVVNTWSAPLIIGETLTKDQFRSTILIFIGAVIAVVNAPRTHKSYSLDDLLLLFRNKMFIIYALIITALVVFLLIMFLRAEHLALTDQKAYNTLWLRSHPISIAALSGILGAQSLLVAKASMLIILDLIAGHTAAASRFETYIIILSMFGLLLTQTHTLNCALQRFDAVFVMPVFQVFWITAGVVGAAAYYREFASVGVINLTLSLTGFVIIAFGIYALAMSYDLPQRPSLPSSAPEPSLREVQLVVVNNDNNGVINNNSGVIMKNEPDKRQANGVMPVREDDGDVIVSNSPSFISSFPILGSNTTSMVAAATTATAAATPPVVSPITTPTATTPTATTPTHQIPLSPRSIMQASLSVLSTTADLGIATLSLHQGFVLEVAPSQTHSFYNQLREDADDDGDADTMAFSKRRSEYSSEWQRRMGKRAGSLGAERNLEGGGGGDVESRGGGVGERPNKMRGSSPNVFYTSNSSNRTQDSNCNNSTDSALTDD